MCGRGAGSDAVPTSSRVSQRGRVDLESHHIQYAVHWARLVEQRYALDRRVRNMTDHACSSYAEERTYGWVESYALCETALIATEPLECAGGADQCGESKEWSILCSDIHFKSMEKIVARINDSRLSSQTNSPAPPFAMLDTTLFRLFIDRAPLIDLPLCRESFPRTRSASAPVDIAFSVVAPSEYWYSFPPACVLPLPISGSRNSTVIVCPSGTPDCRVCVLVILGARGVCPIQVGCELSVMVRESLGLAPSTPRAFGPLLMVPV